MNLDNKLFKVCYDLLNNHDSVWMRRKRKLNTKTIFEYLVNGAITNTGISTCVNVQQQFSHVAMIKARKKLDTKIFFDINKLLHKEDTYEFASRTRSLTKVRRRRRVLSL
jgi:hypothetical protein